MTLDQIQKSSPEFKAKLQKAVEGKEISLILTALKMEIVDRLGRVPMAHAGQTYDGAVSNWHSYLHGMQTVVKMMEEVGTENVNKMPPPEQELPHEHAIPSHLVEARKAGKFKVSVV